MLSRFFGDILTTTQIPLLRRRLPSLSDTYRDRVRDHLSATDFINFPRFRQSSITASDIFVRMCRFEGDRHSVSLKFSCDNESCHPQTKEHSAAFFLLVHNAPPAGHGLVEKATFRLWLSSYFHEMRAKPPQCQLCEIPYSCSSLSIIPLPWIWIDVPLGGDQLFLSSTTLTLEQGLGSNIDYTPTSIIYVGGEHLSTRFEDTSGRQ